MPPEHPDCRQIVTRTSEIGIGAEGGKFILPVNLLDILGMLGKGDSFTGLVTSVQVCMYIQVRLCTGLSKDLG